MDPPPPYRAASDESESGTASPDYSLHSALDRVERLGQQMNEERVELRRQLDIAQVKLRSVDNLPYVGLLVRLLPLTSFPDILSHINTNLPQSKSIHIVLRRTTPDRRDLCDPSGIWFSPRYEAQQSDFLILSSTTTYEELRRLLDGRAHERGTAPAPRPGANVYALASVELDDCRVNIDKVNWEAGRKTLLENEGARLFWRVASVDDECWFGLEERKLEKKGIEQKRTEEEKSKEWDVEKAEKRQMSNGCVLQ